MASALSSKQRREYDSTLFSLINKEYACYSYNPRLYEQGERLAASLVPSSVRAELSDVVGRVLLPEQTLEINDFLYGCMQLTEQEKLSLPLQEMKVRIDAQHQQWVAQNKKWYDFVRPHRRKRKDLNDMLKLMVGIYILNEAVQKNVLFVHDSSDPYRVGWSPFTYK